MNRAQEATSSAASRKASATGAEFQALLERLEARVQGLDATSDKVASPRDLSAAVGQAEASLEEALSLGSKLIEAFRAEGQRAGLKGGEQ